MRAPVVLLVLLVISADAVAQPAAPAERSTGRPFELVDNSFLVEEAFNQEANTFQNILGFVRREDDWELAFTQEWPIGSTRHQASYTFVVRGVASGAGIGDALINYRLQVLFEGPGRPAVALRIGLVVPSGSAPLGRGRGSAGLQANLPFSKQTRNVYWHWNAGVTWLPDADATLDAGGRREVSLFTPQLAASAIWRARPMLHVMLESVVVFEHFIESPLTTSRDVQLTVSPGLRGGWNLGDRQLILGVAAPIVLGAGRTEADLFGYLSYELPFRR